MNYIEHSAKGSTWTKKNHKYIRKEGNRYIYDDDYKKEVRQRNFFKGRKLVRKNAFNGEIEQSGNAKERSFRRRSLAESRKFFKDAQDSHNKFIEDADRSNKEFINQTNKDHYNFLKSVDDNYYKAVKQARKFEDPKAWTSLLKQAKKMNLQTLEMVSKEYTDNSLKGRLAKRKISKLKKQLNSKKMNRMTGILSRVASKYMKIQNKFYVNRLDKMRKQAKASANAQHKEFIAQTKADHEKWKKEANKSQEKWYKNGLKERSDWAHSPSNSTVTTNNLLKSTRKKK